MRHEKEIRWLYGQLPELIEKKILSEESASMLKAHYGPEPSRNMNLPLVITSVLGSLLIGAGIILLFATNWEQLSRTHRTILSFAPLFIAQLLYGYTFFRKNSSAAWIESSSVFLMLMLACTIALISQTYNLGGTLKEFVLSWMMLSIPLMYLMRSSLVCMFYLIGISYWSTMAYSSDIAVWYWALLAAAVPHMILNIDPERPGIRTNILGWTIALTLVVSTGSVTGDFGGKTMVLAIALVLVLLYLIGKILFRHGQTIWSRPFQTVTIFIISFYSLTLCYTWHLRYFRHPDENTFLANQLLAVLAILAIAVLLVYNIRRNYGINYFVVAFPILLMTGIFLYHDDQETLPVILFNIYTLSFGIFYIWWGLKSEQISFVNAGMIFVSVLLLERFFDKDISFVIKGVIFILIGIGFLTVNIVLIRKLRLKHAR